MLRDHRPVPQRPDTAPSPPQLSQDAGGEGGGLDLLDEAVRLHDLAVSRRAEGRLHEALPLCRQAFALVEHAVGLQHPDVATLLNTLAGMYADLGDYAEAEQLSLRSVAMMEPVTGSLEVEVLRVQSLCTLAGIYRVQGRYAEAEPLYRRALALAEVSLGADDLEVATCLNNLEPETK
jgi:tetratricopeptide (TPR) repeat protein